jgi:hypothetical protein
MPTAFQLVLGAVALLGLGALFLVGRRLVRAWLAYRGTRVVVCPENQQTAAIEVDARHAALTAAHGEPQLQLDSCTRWPERGGCSQECLAQVTSAPGACLLLSILGDWYRGRKCAYCGRVFETLHWHDHRPALVAPSGELHEWASFPPERIYEVLASHAPVCWDCGVAERFRRGHPELVTDRPPRTGIPPSMT